MSSNPFRQRLREYVAESVAKPGEHRYAELAEQFLADNPELARSYLNDLARTAVAKLTKELCEDSPTDKQMSIFGGFPTAIAIADGVVKATRNCVLNDLGAGLAYRQDNVDRARERLKSYADSMQLYEALRSSDEETVGEVADRVKDQGRKST